MILVDTQTIAWLAFSPEKLSVAANHEIAEARVAGGIAIADKTLWELAMMASKGKLDLDTSLADFLVSVEQHFTVLPITAAIAARSVQFTKNFPKNPSDRIIAATALVNGLTLISSDRDIRNSGEVHCIW